MRNLVEEKGLDKKILNGSQTRLIAILMGMIVRMKKAGISDDNIAINLKDKDVDILVHGFVPQDAKSWIRMIAYKTRLFKLYSLLYMYSRLQLTFAARTSCVRFDFER